MANYRETLVKWYLLWLVLVQPRHWPSLFGIIFSGSHLCMLTLLSIWTWKLPHQTFSHVRFTLLYYSTVGTWSHRLAFILCWLTPRNKRNANIFVLILLVKEKMLTTRSCRRKSHSQLLVSELFSSGTNSTYSNCEFSVHIHKNDQEWL